MNWCWRNIKQAWYTADLILNGFLRQENVEVTWWDPQRHSNIKREYSYKGELAKIGTEWPETEKECGLYWQKIPQKGEEDIVLYEAEVGRGLPND